MSFVSRTALCGLALAALAGCATPTVTAVNKASDTTLSCEQIVTEMHESERLRQEAQKEKGATGTNVAAAVFFWPAMLATYSNVEEATRAADDRLRVLADLKRQKNCP